MVLAGHSIKCHASRWQHGAGARIALVPERGEMLAYIVFAKSRPFLDAQDAADGTSRGTDRSTDHRPEGSGRSFACDRTRTVPCACAAKGQVATKSAAIVSDFFLFMSAPLWFQDLALDVSDG
jgi:hypothetical protein